MTRAVVGLVLACAVASPLLAQQTDSAPTRIVGRVTAENDAVLPRVRVAVAVQGAPPSEVMTDERGGFVLPLPNPPLPVRITLTKAGYAAQSLDLARGDVAAAGTRQLQVRLARGAAISGQVVDPSGGPVVYALVVAQQVTPAATVVPPSQLLAETDDRGEYRLGGLPAGRYTVAVRGVPTAQRDLLSSLAQRLTLNPDGPLPWDETSAVSTVELRAGGESTGVNLTLTAAPPPPAVPPTPTNLPPGQLGSSVITGRVLTTGGRPLNAAVVRATRTGMVGRAAVTDREGRFAIRDLPAGSFTLAASKTGYVTLEYGQARANQSGKAVTVRDGETLERIDIALPTGSVVTGTVVDDYGEPIAGASVRALQLRMAGDVTMAVAATGVRARQTDDQGRYRLFGLLPGKYIVSAMLDTEVSSTDRTGASGYAPMFYPGTTEVARASQLQVDIGGETPVIDLVFTRVPTARIAGIAFDTTGQPLKSGLFLFESQRTGGILLEPRTTRPAPDGSFAFSNVPPGRYVVQAMAPANPAAAPQPGPGTPAVDFGMQYVTVNDADPPPVTIRTASGSTVEGRIVKEGTADPGARFSVYPFPTDFDQSPVIGSGPAGLTMLDGDRFRVVGITGPRRFTLGNAPPGWYLKSAIVNGTDAADVPFDFGLKGETFRDVEVVVSGNGASLRGVVTDDRGNPVNDYGVVVFSTDRDRWFRASPRVKLARPSQTGAFVVEALPPGDYFVVALDRLDGTPGAGEWQSPSFLESLSSRATRLTLAEGETRASTLRVITR